MKHFVYPVAMGFVATSLAMLAACGSGSDSDVAGAVMSDTDYVAKTSETSTEGSFTDSRDGKTYKTVKIGSQTWMAENLNYKVDNSLCFNDDEANCDKYGRLYRWDVAMDLESSGLLDTLCAKECAWYTPSSRVRGICPEGWHLPTRGEWATLVNIMGGHLKAGRKLKSTTGWADNGGGNGTDKYGFNGIPSGSYYGEESGYDDLNSGAYYWSTTFNVSQTLGDTSAYAMSLSSYDNEARLDYFFSSESPFSIRCVQD